MPRAVPSGYRQFFKGLPQGLKQGRDGIERQGLLVGFGAQRLEAHAALFSLLIADHQGPRGTAAVGAFELFAKGSSGAIELHGNTGLPEVARQTEEPQPQPPHRDSPVNGGGQLGGEPGRCTIGIGFGCSLEHQQQTLHAQSPADRRRWRTAQLLHEAVVTATATHGGLGTELVAGDFKGGVTVVIEATHQTGVHLEGNRQLTQQLPEPQRSERHSPPIKPPAGWGHRPSSAWVVGFLLSRMRRGLVVSRS